MFDRLQVENFRGFESLGLRELARCNLIVGSNDRTVGSLFHRRDLTKVIVVRGSIDKGDHAGRSREVRYELRDDPPGIRHRMAVQRSNSSWVVQLSFDDAAHNARGACAFTFGAGRVQGRTGNVVPDFPLAVITTNQPPRHLAHYARWFSKLEEAGGQDKVVALLRDVEPRLQAISVAASDHGPYLHADLGLGRRMPCSFLSDGFTRFPLLAMRMFKARSGMMLIDEIESSFHRSVLDRVFAFVRDAARELDVQLFATTHSWEILEAARSAFAASKPYELAVHRLAHDGERAVAHHLGEGAIEAALATGLDIR